MASKFAKLSLLAAAILSTGAGWGQEKKLERSLNFFAVVSQKKTPGKALTIFVDSLFLDSQSEKARNKQGAGQH